MCGICGFVGPADRTVLRAMTNSLVHRGPDEVGFFEDNDVSLGAQRLSIIDVEGGHQPVTNEDSTVHCVYNGEIYNFVDVRDELLQKGHRFATKSDTEVVVHAYEEYGLEAVRRFSGMFGFAVWDSRSKRLLLARDRIGMKPLYWASTPGGI